MDNKIASPEYESVVKLAEAVTSLKNSKKIYSIKALAEYLQCSYPTARKIAASGLFPRYQAKGTRQIFFLESEILKALSNEHC